MHEFFDVGACLGLEIEEEKSSIDSLQGCEIKQNKRLDSKLNSKKFMSKEATPEREVAHERASERERETDEGGGRERISASE